MNKNFNKKNKEFSKIDKINKDFKKLFFLNRSLTGEGNIKTLEILNNIVPIKIKKIKSGTKVYDWLLLAKKGCLLLVLHRPQGTAAFSARTVPPVDEDGLGGEGGRAGAHCGFTANYSV